MRTLDAHIRHAPGPADEGAEASRITQVEAATRFISEPYLPALYARFAKAAEIADSAFVTVADAVGLPRSYAWRRSGWWCASTPSPMRGCGYDCCRGRRGRTVSSPRVQVHVYPDATLAVFHGPRLLACYDRDVALSGDRDLKARVIRFDAPLVTAASRA